MVTLQQIPFYLPLNINFDTTQIGSSTYYDEFDYNWIYNVGSSISFYDPLSKFVITHKVNNIVKEHIFINITNDETGTTPLYPIAIKTYNINDSYNRYSPKTMLLLPGITSVLNQISTILNTKYYFLSKLYLQKALDICNPEKVDYLLASIVYKTNSIFHTLDYINNENNPSILFNYNAYIRQLQYETLDYRSMDIMTSTEQIENVISLFNPKYDYPLIYDNITNVSLQSNKLSTRDLLNAISIFQVKEDNLAMTNPFVDKILNESSNIIYACNSINYNEVFAFNLYVLYEVFQDTPFKEGYIKYILSNNGRLEIDLNSLFLTNWYYNLRYDGRLHSKLALTWVHGLTKELECLLESISTNINTTPSTYLEVIIQDYHVLITINNGSNKTTIVFDMITLMLLSKTLFFTEDQYTNDQYNYYPSLQI